MNHSNEDCLSNCALCLKITKDVIISILPNINEGIIELCLDCVNQIKRKLNEAEAKISVFSRVK